MIPLVSGLEQSSSWRQKVEVVARGWEWGEWALVFNENRVQVFQDENSSGDRWR